MSDDADATPVDSTQDTLSPPVNPVIDRPRNFVIDDSHDQGPAAFRATKLMKATGSDAPPSRE